MSVTDGSPPQGYCCDYDETGDVGLGDYMFWLECYRDFVGDPGARPPTPPQPRVLRQEDGLTKHRVPSSASPTWATVNVSFVPQDSILANIGGTVVAIAPVFLLFLLLQRDSISGLTSGAVKG